MTKSVSFLDREYEVFSDAAWRAALTLHVGFSATVAELNRVHTISCGLREIFKIVRNNNTQMSDDDREDGVDTPLSPNTIECLLAMGAAVADDMASSIVRLVERTEVQLGVAHD